ncbi:amino acid ABC transporter permease [Paraburkholderia hospita]|jgi:polar amino acid transport system permease protein|uniref:amino acid ABC transporter permease n=1 Tax=Paraburkholderia hospita TaxID=169430 RepID=UPI000B3469FC|nr:amino acid ABC transporter permease [Paraburkholderia hospita]OUL96666.1 amino acid ABC transporter permease [Paraburkholderia hospita]SOE84185.1 amino acid ABC transporter membrane protein, PAAT family [Burkholderia sp. YR290]
MDAFLQNFLDWPLLVDSLPALLSTGLVNTLVLSLFSTVLGIVAGMVLALMAVSNTRWLMFPAQVFIDVFRGLPAALVILVVGQGLAPIGLSIFGPNPYPLAIVALALISSAYIAEIFRSGIQSVGRGQMYACQALGMTYWSGMRHVIVPQGVRRILPALANQFISIVKDSSLVYFLGLLTSQRDLFTIGQNTAVNTANLSPLVAAGVVYLLITVPLTHAINHIDRWTNRFSNPGARGGKRAPRSLRAARREAALQSQATAQAAAAGIAERRP